MSGDKAPRLTELQISTTSNEFLTGTVEDSFYNPSATATQISYSSIRFDDPQGPTTGDLNRSSWAEKSFSPLPNVPGGYGTSSSNPLQPRLSIRSTHTLDNVDRESSICPGSRHSTQLPGSPTIYTSQITEADLIEPLRPTAAQFASTPGLKNMGENLSFQFSTTESFTDNFSTIPPDGSLSRKSASVSRKSKSDVSFWSFSGELSRDNVSQTEDPPRSRASLAGSKLFNSNARRSGSHIKDRLSGLLRKPSINGKSGSGSDTYNAFASSKVVNRNRSGKHSAPTTPLLTEAVVHVSPRNSLDSRQGFISSPVLRANDELHLLDPTQRTHAQLVQDIKHLQENLRNVSTSKHLLDQSVRTMTRELTQCRAALKGTEERAETMTGQLQMAKEANDSLQNKFIVARGELQQTQQQAQALRRERREWMEKFQEVEKVASQMTDEFRKLQQDYSNLETAKEASDEKLHTLEGQLAERPPPSSEPSGSEWQQLLQEKDKTIRQLTGDKEVLTEAMSELVERLNVANPTTKPIPTRFSHEMSLDEPQSVSSTTLDRSALESIKGTYEVSLQRAEREQQLILESMNDLMEQIQQHKQEARTWATERTDYQDKVSHLEQHVQNLETELQTLADGQHEVELVRAQYETQIQALEMRLKNLPKPSEPAAVESTELLTAERDELATERSRLVTKVQALEADLIRQTTQRQELVQRVTDLENEVSEGLEAQEKLLTEQLELVEHTGDLKQQVTQLEKENHDLQAKVEVLQVTTLAAEENRLEADVKHDALALAQQEKEPKLSATIAEVGLLKRQLRDYRNKRERLQCQLSEHTQGMAELELKCEVAVTRTQTLEAEQRVLAVRLRDVLLENQALQFEINHQLDKRQRAEEPLADSLLQATSKMMEPANEDGHLLQMSSVGMFTQPLGIEVGIQTSCTICDAETQTEVIPEPLIPAVPSLGLVVPILDQAVQTESTGVDFLERGLANVNLVTPSDNRPHDETEESIVQYAKNPTKEVSPATSETCHMDRQFSTVYSLANEVMDDRLNLRSQIQELEKDRAFLSQQLAVAEENLTKASQKSQQMEAQVADAEYTQQQAKEALAEHLLTCKVTHSALQEELRQAKEELARVQVQLSTMETQALDVRSPIRLVSRFSSRSPATSTPTRESSETLYRGTTLYRTPVIHSHAGRPSPQPDSSMSNPTSPRTRSTSVATKGKVEVHSPRPMNRRRTDSLSPVSPKSPVTGRRSSSTGRSSLASLVTHNESRVELLRERDELAQTVDQLKVTLKEHTTTVTRLEEQVEEMQSKLDEREETYQARLEKMRMKEHTANEHLEELIRALDHSKHQTVNLERRLADEQEQWTTKQGDKETALAHLTDTLRSKDQRLNILLENLQEQNARAEVLERELQQMKEHEANRSDTPRLSPSKVASSAILQDLESKVVDLHRQLADEQLKNKLRGNNLEVMEEQHQAQISQYRDSVTSLELELQGLRSRLRELENTNNGLYQELAELQRERETMLCLQQLSPSRAPSIGDGRESLTGENSGEIHHRLAARASERVTLPADGYPVSPSNDLHPTQRHVPSSLSLHRRTSSIISQHNSRPLSAMRNPQGLYVRRSTDVASLLAEGAPRQSTLSPTLGGPSPSGHSVEEVDRTTPYSRRRLSVSSTQSFRTGRDWRSGFTTFAMQTWNSRFDSSMYSTDNPLYATPYHLTSPGVEGTPSYSNRQPAGGLNLGGNDNGSHQSTPASVKHDMTSLIAQLELKDFELQKTQLFHQEQSRKLIRANSRIEHLEGQLSNSEKTVELLQKDVLAKRDLVRDLQARLDQQLAATTDKSSTAVDLWLSESQMEKVLAKHRQTTAAVERLCQKVQESVTNEGSPWLPNVTESEMPTDDAITTTGPTDLTSPATIPVSVAKFKQLANALIREDHCTTLDELCVCIHDLHRTLDACQTILQCLKRVYGDDDGKGDEEGFTSPTFTSVPHLVDTLRGLDHKFTTYHRLMSLAQALERVLVSRAAENELGEKPSKLGITGHQSAELNPVETLTVHRALQDVHDDLQALVSLHVPDSTETSMPSMGIEDLTTPQLAQLVSNDAQRLRDYLPSHRTLVTDLRLAQQENAKLNSLQRTQ
ncbi:hypothetical protein IWQ61_007813, partial [Dispira simplex]